MSKPVVEVEREAEIVLLDPTLSALLFAGFVNGSAIFELPTDAFAVAAATVGRTKLGPSFGQILIRGEF